MNAGLHFIISEEGRQWRWEGANVVWALGGYWFGGWNMFLNSWVVLGVQYILSYGSEPVPFRCLIPKPRGGQCTAYHHYGFPPKLIPEDQ